MSRHFAFALKDRPHEIEVIEDEIVFLGEFASELWDLFSRADAADDVQPTDPTPQLGFIPIVIAEGLENLGTRLRVPISTNPEKGSNCSAGARIPHSITETLT